MISHLLFADDCYLFFKAIKSEADVMKRILNRYASISCQVINFNKSTITFSSNTDVHSLMEVCNQLGVNEVDTPGKYLGLPMSLGRSKTATFNFLQERINQKLQTWSNHTLSRAGKIKLLKTAAQSIPNF